MTALLNFGKNFGLSIAAFVVLNVNRITGRAKR